MFVGDKMTALVTLAEVKDYLSINSTTFDAKLSNLITYSSGLIENYCGRSFAAANVVYEYQDGGKPYVLANRIPINNVQSIAEYDGTQYVPLTAPMSGGGLANVSSNTSAAAQFTWNSDTGKIWKGLSLEITADSETFSPYPKGVRLEYNGGYTTIPDDIKLCTMDLVKSLHKGMDAQETRFSNEYIKQSPYTGGFPPHIRRVLDLYRIY